MEPVTVQIPNTIDEVIPRLSGIERLITASGWERAAIVYAFTHEYDHRGQPRKDIRESANTFSTVQFASLGIQGLRSDNTVREHRRAWQSAIDAGEAVDPRPGDVIELPDRPYPSAERPTGLVRIDESQPVESTYRAVREVIERQPEVAERIEKEYEHRFIQRAGRDPEFSAKVFRAYEEHHPEPMERPHRDSDLGNALIYDFANMIYGSIKRQQDALSKLLGHLEAHGLRESERVHFDQYMSTLEKSRLMIADIEERSSRAAGVDYDEVFRRLVNG